MLGISPDGKRVYFAAEGQIVAGQPVNATTKLYLWDHGNVRYIATLVSSAHADDELNWWPSASYRTSRIADDGRYLLFTTAAPLAPGFDSAGHKEIYRYDSDTNQIACVSCGSGAGPATSEASINFPGAGLTAEYVNTETRVISANGQRVFFDTADALVSGDTNGKVDAYEWDNGVLHLLSSGTAESNSYFVNASENGDDAYLVTRQELVGRDTDKLLDLYDARVGGGLPEPALAPPPCAGEACQGVGGSPLNALAPASARLGASGNLPALPAVKNAHAKATKAQKLAKALRACRARKHGQRKKCEARARKRYGTRASKSGGRK